MKYDLIILGGGPAGYAAAIAAGRERKKVVLFEGEHIGGVCLNKGCIPMKYLLDKGAQLEKIRALVRCEIVKDSGLFSYSRIIRGKDNAVSKLIVGVTRLLAHYGIEVVFSFAEITAPDTIRCNGKTYTAKNILIATGSAPSVPPIPGIQYAADSSWLLAQKRIPKSLAIIGGGVIGVELAEAMHAFGSRVTVLEALGRLFPKGQEEPIAMLTQILSHKGIKIETGVIITAIELNGANKKIRYETNGQLSELTVDQVLAATGRKPSLVGIDTNKLGLKTSAGRYLAVDDYMRTNLPNIYAAGDITGRWQLAHSAYIEAEYATSNMFGKPRKVDLSVMPYCVYTNPPFAAVGMTTGQATAAGIDYTVGCFPYAACGMAVAADATDGMAMVLSEQKTGRILGAHILGEAAHELISTAAMAIAHKLTVHDWENLITAHPSLSEILPEAALGSIGKARHIP